MKQQQIDVWSCNYKVWFIGENANYTASEYTWESAKPLVNFSELQLSNGENRGASGTGIGYVINPMLKVLDEMYRAQDDLARREYLITWMTVLMMFADRLEEQIVHTSSPTVIDGGVWRSGGTGLRSGLQLGGDGGLGDLEEQRRRRPWPAAAVWGGDGAVARKIRRRKQRILGGDIWRLRGPGAAAIAWRGWPLGWPRRPRHRRHSGEVAVPQGKWSGRGWTGSHHGSCAGDDGIGDDPSSDGHGSSGYGGHGVHDSRGALVELRARGDDGEIGSSVGVDQEGRDGGWRRSELGVAGTGVCARAVRDDLGTTGARVASVAAFRGRVGGTRQAWRFIEHVAGDVRRNRSSSLVLIRGFVIFYFHSDPEAVTKYLHRSVFYKFD
ncbi:unnamed protein product [Miscanthus lutarioriparius]|uniref:Uncharacterized protein n=1 Tax=Miscanthus lutarioriparius TaxID=422564 RepID=A0A811QDY8_9POAL|nr:unnamed protein product [Miscanthus lutarioriparius]